LSNAPLPLSPCVCPEDPLYRYNEKKYVWVTKERWVYSTTLDMSSYPVSASDASAPWLLRFDGVDTVANVTWNGKPLGSPRSMFVAFTYEIPGAWLSADGLNKVEVAIEPAMEYTAGLRDQTPYSIPEVLFYNTWPGYSAKNFVRKPSSDFGWDWGPAFIPVGIVGDVRLMKSSVGQLEDVLVFQEHHADGSVTLTVKSIVANVPKDGASAKLTVALSELGDGKGTTRTVQLAGGENEFIDTLTMPKPELWWPVGLGQPRLYRLTVTLAYADGTVAVVKEKNVGFRTIEVVETPVEGSEGLSFFFKVNGVEVFVKGANLIPFHVFYNQATHEEMDWILQSSVDANMNMVRYVGPDRLL
jgi:beta-mannosidase